MTTSLTGRHTGRTSSRRVAGPSRGIAVAGLSAALVAAGLTSLFGATAGSAAAPSLNIDAGGPGLTAPDGTVWTSDNGYSTGKVGSTADSVAGPDGNAVLKNYRYGMRAFNVPVPNGTYRVTYAMAETYWTAAGKRVFSSTAEGVTVFTNLDVFKAVGHDVELTKSAVVTVKDGVLSLTFKATKDLAMLGALRIDPVVTATPTDTTTSAAPAPVTTSAAPAPVTTSAAPAPVTTSAAPAPVTTSAAPAPVTTSAAPAPTTTSAAPAPTQTTQAPPAADALRYAPPVLVNPVTMAFPEGSTSLLLDTTKDYILTLPQGRALKNAKGLTFTGGRNIVIIGGTVDVGDGVSGVRRAAYLSKATPNGTTYIEGVRFISSTQGSLTEGIDLASPDAKVVIQNVTIEDPLVGTYATNHADAIQAWAGPAVLQIDGFTATTGYQGFFLLPNQLNSAPVYDWSLHRIQLFGNDSGYLLWRDGGTYAIDTSDVYVTGSHIANGGLWPNAAAWPGVTVGTAPEAFGSTAGYGYVSPGYIAG